MSTGLQGRGGSGPQAGRTHASGEALAGPRLLLGGRRGWDRAGGAGEGEAVFLGTGGFGLAQGGTGRADGQCLASQSSSRLIPAASLVQLKLSP